MDGLNSLLPPDWSGVLERDDSLRLGFRFALPGICKEYGRLLGTCKGHGRPWCLEQHECGGACALVGGGFVEEALRAM